MNFGEMLTYWRMKDMIVEETVISDTRIYGEDSKGRHMVITAKIKEASNYAWKYAIVIYRKNGSRIGLINADIFYRGFGDKNVPDRVCRINASVHQLKEEMIGFD